MSANAMADVPATARDHRIFLTRLVAGLVQAAALYLLVEAAEAPLAWPATAPGFFRPMLLIAAFVPLILSQGIGHVPARALAIWMVVASVIIATLGFHDAARGAAPSYPAQDTSWPGHQVVLALSLGLFIAHVLVVDSVTERRFRPSYARHFESAWNLGLQVVLATIFVGVFWLLLYLGAALFRLVDIDFFMRLIEHHWFAIPATSLAIAASIHVTDLQPAMIRGTRSLALTMFSWLLPLLSAILLGFLGVLPFISLAPLWKTHFGTDLLLIASGAVILLINCCYQDGAGEPVATRIRRFAVTVGAIELVPLAGLAVRGLSLRVGQYGWTTERIFAAAVTGVVCCHAIGYTCATLGARSSLRRIELTNIGTAWLILALILALFTPIADPARLMVADQLARLESGVVRPGRFDFAALKFDGARWGSDALAKLSRIGDDHPDSAEIRSAATWALGLTNRYTQNRPDLAPPSAVEVAGRVDVYPSGRVLPAAFLDAGLWGLPGGGLPTCLRSDNVKCSAIFVSLRPGEPEALVFFGNLGIGISPVFEQDSTGKWRQTGQLVGALHCAGVRRGLEHGDVTSQPHAWPDLAIGGQPLVIAPLPARCE